MFRKTQTIDKSRVHTFVADTVSDWREHRDASGKPPAPPQPTTLRKALGCQDAPTMTEAFNR